MNHHVPFGPSAPPELFGSVTVGERGQVVIPRAARDQMGIKAGDKLLAIGGIPGGQGLVFVKTEVFSALMTALSQKMEQVARLLDAEVDPQRRGTAARPRRSRS